MNKAIKLLMTTVCCCALSACNEGSDSQSKESSDGFVLTSSVMADGGGLPVTYTCEGEAINPPLSWSGAPEGTEYYALIMNHNAPDSIHWYWALYNINADVTEIKSNQTVGIAAENNVPGSNPYSPPCSQGPGEKYYTFTLYALSAEVVFDNEADVDAAMLFDAINENNLGTVAMTVSYARSESELAAANDQPKPEPPPEPRTEPAPEPRPEPTQQSPIVEVDSERCDIIKSSINDAGFDQSVFVKCDEDYAYITSDTYPDHELMTGITGTNEQVPVPATNYAAPILLNPAKADSITTIDAALGVAVNGVPIYDYSAQGELDVNQYDEGQDTLALGQLDNCGGHSGRGDDYHYHASPTCMIDAMDDKSDTAIIGWAYDGYPLYGYNNLDGSEIAIGELDVCNGQDDPTFGYRYHTSVTPPYIFQCLVGAVDTDKLPRVSPLSGDTQKIRADLKPPRGGVENLVYTTAEDGSRTMTYTYQGEEYFTTYSPSEQSDNCYDFSQKTISNGGGIETGTFCRGSVDNDQRPPAPEGDDVQEKSSDVSPLDTTISGDHNFKLEAWADNWFAAYVEDELLVEDSVSITTERSFNAESIEFSASYPIQLNLILKDFKQNDTGLEYIGARNQQMGDGGFIMQITDTDSNEVVAVSNSSWKCEVLHEAPLNKLCESESDPIAGEGYCTFTAKEAPENWLQVDFDDSSWADAVEHTVASVSPKDGYTEINWDSSAQLIWGDDLETDNTLICRTTITQN